MVKRFLLVIILFNRDLADFLKPHKTLLRFTYRNLLILPFSGFFWLDKIPRATLHSIPQQNLQGLLEPFWMNLGTSTLLRLIFFSSNFKFTFSGTHPEEWTRPDSIPYCCQKWWGPDMRCIHIIIIRESGDGRVSFG